MRNGLSTHNTSSLKKKSRIQGTFSYTGRFQSSKPHFSCKTRHQLFYLILRQVLTNASHGAFLTESLSVIFKLYLWNFTASFRAYILIFSYFLSLFRLDDKIFTSNFQPSRTLDLPPHLSLLKLQLWPGFFFFKWEFSSAFVSKNSWSASGE